MRAPTVATALISALFFGPDDGIRGLFDPAPMVKASGQRQRGVERLGMAYPTNNAGQYRNDERARKRRRVATFGGRRQYLKIIKALRRMQARPAVEVL